VSYPSAAKLISGPVIRRGGGTVTTGQDSVTFTADNLRSNTPLRIEMRFAPGSMIEEPPTWQTREARAQLSAPYFGAAAVAILLLGALVLVLLWNRYPRPQREKAAFRPTVPPGDLPPAIAGALNGVGAQPRWVNALATLFDLARRGALSVEETGEKAWYRRHDFRINLLNRPAELRLHERGLLRLLFETKEGMVESVRLADLQGRVARHFKWFNEPLKEEMQSAGLLDSQRLRMRNWFFALGFILLVADGLSTIAGALLIQRFGGWPFIVMVSFFLLSMAAFVMGGVYSPLSDRGAEEATRWHGFYEYLRDVTKGREPAWDARQFERYLPYAASYGLAEKWARAFQRSAHRGPSAPKLGQRDGVEIPPWFHALATAPDQSMASFAAFTAASHSTGSSGAGGAGGAAGGGGSGAG
jgi:hypothetical protein